MKAQRRLLTLVSIFMTVILASALGQAALIAPEIQKKILNQGVPAPALDRLVRFLEQNIGREFRQDIYTCKKQDEKDIRPCAEADRKSATSFVKLEMHKLAVIIDFSRPSTEKRLFLIDWTSGEVTRDLVSHGKNSGSLYAYRFSNIKDSKQTSLGIYVTGQNYSGKYGNTLRLYGLQTSNDQAFNRDIVMHGARYANPEFITSKKQDGSLFGRLGVSWGCPAIPLKTAKILFPQLVGGALVYHFHPSLEDDAQSGKEVVGKDMETAALNP